MTPTVTAEIELLAPAPDVPRHAFPRPVVGFPPRSLCGQERWTVRLHPDQGDGFCVDCVTVMREQLRWLTDALALVDADDQAGDHYAGRPR